MNDRRNRNRLILNAINYSITVSELFPDIFVGELRHDATSQRKA